MRFSAEVRWSPQGVLQGVIDVPGTAPEPFYGLIQLVGVLEDLLGPPPAPLSETGD